ncbi:MAG: plastocyanin/azurin family copper-binding protein [Solirubrobacterales bacterium]
MRRYSALLAVPVLALAFMAGCGGSDDSSSSEAPTANAPQQEKPASSAADAEVLDLAADPSGALVYDTDTLDAKAGNVAIAFTNDSPVGHDVVVEQDGTEVGRSSILTSGSETVALNDLKAGKYTYYCSLPGHREAGMEGTLTVK